MTDEIIEKAIRRYAKDCEVDGTTFQNPSITSHVDDDGLVVLENIHGTLARYRPSTDATGRVRFERVNLSDDEPLEAG